MQDYPIIHNEALLENNRLRDINLHSNMIITSKELTLILVNKFAQITSNLPNVLVNLKC